MTNYRIELQAFVDAAASFTEPALGHHKAWAEAVARARIALSVPESPANTVCLITPPPELVQEWVAEIWHEGTPVRVAASDLHITTQAARWGADQELEACCEWLDEHLAYENNVTDNLRADRRPKPKSLKQQAIDELVAAYNADQMDDTTFETLGRIIKSLPD